MNLKFHTLSLLARPLAISLLATSSILSFSIRAQQVDEAPKEPSVPAEWFGEGVRPTEPLTAAEELKSFHLPTGFVVELVAEEPQIAKPMNLAFDRNGRLWVTQSVEYPYQAKDGEVARDEIRVLEDVDGDGYREKVTVFADGLNVPIGLLPFGDGCLCFSIPNILYLRDVDGDLRCDERKVIVGPFDTTRDTHGMVNSLRMGLDGWIYANHGFNNQSKVAGSDGKMVSLVSGNVFRFRPDGASVEIYTQGQVNPFGTAEDDFGTFYTADCHSKPISQLIRGGCYPSFGRPDDGLGFVPPTMEHLHGSTAIAGLAIGRGSDFPPNFQDNFFSGNVMTSRINRNRIDRFGATVRATELPDLLTSDDPWFRPVDLRFGPDGALYVADFYNKIIGHYEVPLEHPGRDRFRGRIFRIRYIGDAQDKLLSKENGGSQQTSANVEAPLEWRLSHSNPQIRRDAVTDLVAKNSHRIEPDFAKWLHDRRDESSWMRIGLMWGHVQAFGRLPKGWKVMANSGGALERTHLATAIATLADFDEISVLRHWMKSEAVDSTEAVARRAAIEAIGVHGSEFDVDTLVEIAMAAESKDPITSQSAKIACRHLLKKETVGKQAIAKWEASAGVPEAESQMRMALLLSLGDDLAFEPMLRWVARQDPTSSTTKTLLNALSRATPIDSTEKVVELLEQTFGSEVKELGSRLIEMSQAQEKKYGRHAAILDNRTFQVASHLLREESNRAEPSSLPVRSWFEPQGRIWLMESRKLESTQEEQSVLSSIGFGEAYTGQLESEYFVAPKAISFYVFGHNGPPDQADHQKNRIQLVLAGNGQVVRESFPPRSDLGKLVEWNLQDLDGQQVFLRCIDNDSGNAYAWIAIGRISVGGLDRTSYADSLSQFVALGQTLDWSQQRDSLKGLADPERMSTDWRLRLISIVQRKENPLLNSLLQFVATRGWGQQWVHSGVVHEDQLWEMKAWSDDEIVKLAESLCAMGSSKDQRELAKILASRRDRLEILIRCIERGKMGRDALNALDKSWWDALEGNELGERLSKLRPDESTVQAALSQQVEERVRQLASLAGQRDRGASLFKEKCSLCHQIGGQGTVLGPQLEGVGGRGTQRLAEDILLPNQNVDEAFRMTTFLTSDGQVISGLVRERKEDSLVIANQKGESTTIAKSDIEEEKPSELSLMPGNFAEMLTDQQLADLLDFLRSQAKK